MTEIEDLLKILKKEDGKKGTSKIPVFPYFRRRQGGYDLDLIRLAYDFAAEAHQNQKRKTGSSKNKEIDSDQ